MEDIIKLVNEDLEYINMFYPDLKFLNITTIPTAVGIVVFPKLLNMPKEIRSIYSIRIKVTWPLDFPDETIKVYDIDNKINWGLVPDEHHHFYSDGSICTHHELEIQLVKPKNRSLVIIHNATRLYYAYKIYLETGKWLLADLPHGNEATRILLREFLRKQ